MRTTGMHLTVTSFCWRLKIRACEIKLTYIRQPMGFGSLVSGEHDSDATLCLLGFYCMKTKTPDVASFTSLVSNKITRKPETSLTLKLAKHEDELFHYILCVYTYVCISYIAHISNCNTCSRQAEEGVNFITSQNTIQINYSQSTFMNYYK